MPKSIWYMTDAQFLGFRIVRPLKVPSPEVLKTRVVLTVVEGEVVGGSSR